MTTSKLDLSEISGDRGLVIEGSEIDDNFGAAISNAGDLNGDGIDDLIIGAPGAGIGIVPFPVDDVIKESPENSIQGRYGYSDRQGRAYIIFGREGFGNNLDLANLDGNNGFTISGLNSNDNLGREVSSGGDFNGDGFDDLIVSAPDAGETVEEGNYSDGRGETYVVFGKASGFDLNFDLGSLDGSNGFALSGLDSYDNLGIAVSSGGDLNHDGFDDIVVTAPNAGEKVKDGDFSDGRGAAYVIFGSSQPLDRTFDLASLNGTNGFKISGLNSYDNLGSDVSSGGDFNGDGIEDLVIGAPNAGEKIDNPDGISYNDGKGATYIIFGKEAGFKDDFDLGSLDGSNGFSIEGMNGNDNLGRAVDNAGDINNDGFDDLIVTAPFAGDTIDDGDNSFSDSRGEAYVIFGGDKKLNPTLNLTSLDGSNGFKIRGLDSYDNLGMTVSSGGDLNGDGINDLIVSAPNAGEIVDNGDYSDGSGEIYVIFGSEDNFNATIDLNNLDRGLLISGLDRYENLGNVISAAGDLNGDGISDLVAGVPYLDSRGKAYVISGVRPLELLGTEGENILTGDSGDDILSGLGGNDVLRGLSGNDELYGGREDDLIIGGTGRDTLQGDAGKDNLVGEDNDDVLMGNEGADVLFGGNGNDTLAGNSDDDRLLGEAGSDRLTGDTGNDELIGGADDDVLSGGNDNDTLVGGKGNDLLNGGDGNDRLNGIDPTNFGKGETDTLTGGAGKDLFILGNSDFVYYNDGDSSNFGTSDVATITDFDRSQDELQLAGKAALYSLDVFTASNGSINANLIYDSGTDAAGELIAVLENVSADLHFEDLAISLT
jgi:Ca2+-binding RTX toxin-like protein